MALKNPLTKAACHIDAQICYSAPQINTSTDWKLRGNVKLQRSKRPRCS